MLAMPWLAQQSLQHINHLAARGGYRDSGDDAAEWHALETSSRIEQLESSATQDFWAHPEFSEVAALRCGVKAAGATAAGRSPEYRNLLHTYEHSLVTALTRAHELEAAALDTFGDLPAPPVCHAPAFTWFTQLFDQSPKNDDLAELELNFDKFLRRMDAASRRVTIGRGVYYARLQMRDVPLAFGVRWERLQSEQCWQLSASTRIGLRPFSVTCHYPFIGDSPQTRLDGEGTVDNAVAVRVRETGSAYALVAAAPQHQCSEFSNLLRVSGNVDAAGIVLDAEVQSYLIELAKATTPELMVGNGCATITFAQQLDHDLLKYALRVLMAAHAAPATLNLLR
jgi:hypothetical protein